MPTKPTITILIPARNERATIAKTIKIARQAYPDGEIIVADSASTDGTAAVATACKARVIKAGRGKGNAIKAGLAAARGRTVVFFDADITNAKPLMIRTLAEPVLRGECAATIGTFEPNCPQPITELAYVPLVRMLMPDVDAAFPKNPLSGQRALLLETAMKLDLPDGFGVEAAMNAQLVAMRIKTKAVDLGRIKPVFKGTLGPKETTRRTREIIAQVLAEAEKRSLKNRLPIKEIAAGIMQAAKLGLKTQANGRLKNPARIA